VIPPPIVHHFCQDVERNGRFAGFMSLGVDWQKLESPPLRRALAMPPSQKGVLVRRVEPTSPAAAVLRKGDVLLSFDGTPIACDGTVFFRANERITFSFLVSAKHAGETAALTVLRDGKELEVRTALSAPERAVPIHINGRAPSFFLFGGLVFLTLSVPLLRAEYGKDFDFDAPVKLLDAMMHGQVGERERDESAARARGPRRQPKNRFSPRSRTPATRSWSWPTFLHATPRSASRRSSTRACAQSPGGPSPTWPRSCWPSTLYPAGTPGSTWTTTKLLSWTSRRRGRARRRCWSRTASRPTGRPTCRAGRRNGPRAARGRRLLQLAGAPKSEGRGRATALQGGRKGCARGHPLSFPLPHAHGPRYSANAGEKAS
jgi:hypothetical protein